MPKKITWKNDVYSDGTRDYPAVFVTWEAVAEILGEPHTGDSDQDARLIAYLLASGAPAWIADAPGWADDHGWGLYDHTDLSQE